ncbi:helix-turn-helix transcriptional regulator [Paenarthrobacter sp. PH39-S1]|uniref:helix-turn-helix domain-containing protein n=1 Tax=Paenarthrobacter sp. PH39-S1 TaxID=3046204 RepID=UPI0024B9F783|nr:helix-turn-helix transcriptional regulator [Paenarthrobacter sp. PH39-S1]MDJ0356637.1 helix-turn-helix transcriptional regulator [Paenarthrobacter sp. PH39-S1]
MGDIIQFDPTGASWRRHHEPPLRDVFGEIFKDARIERGERLVEVARRAAISVQYLSEIERGRKDASSEVFASVAHALDMSMFDLTGQAAQRLSSTGRTGHTSGPVCLAA